jgi:2-dehydropantoate 2-reductase
MEIYYLYTRPLEIAREAGCPMPKLEMLEAELRFLEADLIPWHVSGTR